VPLGKTLSNNVIHKSIALLKGVAGLSQGRLILQNSGQWEVNLIIAKGIRTRGSKELRQGQLNATYCRLEVESQLHALAQVAGAS
jgi:hypothetical protein